MARRRGMIAALRSQASQMGVPFPGMVPGMPSTGNIHAAPSFPNVMFPPPTIPVYQPMHPIMPGFTGVPQATLPSPAPSIPSPAPEPAPQMPAPRRRRVAAGSSSKQRTGKLRSYTGNFGGRSAGAASGPRMPRGPRVSVPKVSTPKVSAPRVATPRVSVPRVGKSTGGGSRAGAPAAALRETRNVSGGGLKRKSYVGP